MPSRDLQRAPEQVVGATRAGPRHLTGLRPAAIRPTPPAPADARESGSVRLPWSALHGPAAAGRTTPIATGSASAGRQATRADGSRPDVRPHCCIAGGKRGTRGGAGTPPSPTLGPAAHCGRTSMGTPPLAPDPVPPEPTPPPPGGPEPGPGPGPRPPLGPDPVPPGPPDPLGPDPVPPPPPGRPGPGTEPPTPRPAPMPGTRADREIVRDG